MDGDALYYMRADMALLSLEVLAERMNIPVERLAALEAGEDALPFSEEEESLFYTVIDREIRRLSARPGDPSLN